MSLNRWTQANIFLQNCILCGISQNLWLAAWREADVFLDIAGQVRPLDFCLDKVLRNTFNGNFAVHLFLLIRHYKLDILLFFTYNGFQKSGE